MNQIIKIFLNNDKLINLDEICEQIKKIDIDISAEEITKVVPGLKQIYDFTKFCQTVKDKYLLKKIGDFVHSLRDGSITDAALTEYKKKFELGNEKIEKEIEMLVVTLDSYINDKKTLILANFYKSLINKQINWEEFEELRDVLDGYIVGDGEQLKKIVDCSTIKDKSDIFKYASAMRLNSLGLIVYKTGIIFSYGDCKEIIAISTTLGVKFDEFGLRYQN